VGSAMNTVAAIDPRHAAGQRLRERVFRSATLVAAIAVLALLGGVAFSLLAGAWPALAHFRLGFLTREIWNPVTEQFGALESGYGLGATTWEVIWQVVVPYARTGMIGGIMLGLGRALGETMAVTFVIGNAHRIGSSLLAPGTTISASIANEFTEAVGDLYSSSLIALGALLFLITFSVIAAARFMLLRLERRALSSV